MILVDMVVAVMKLVITLWNEWGSSLVQSQVPNGRYNAKRGSSIERVQRRTLFAARKRRAHSAPRKRKAAMARSSATTSAHI
jgi:hypothetical protein